VLAFSSFSDLLPCGNNYLEAFLGERGLSTLTAPPPVPHAPSNFHGVFLVFDPTHKISGRSSCVLPTPPPGMVPKNEFCGPHVVPSRLHKFSWPWDPSRTTFLPVSMGFFLTYLLFSPFVPPCFNTPPGAKRTGSSNASSPSPPNRSNPFSLNYPLRFESFPQYFSQVLFLLYPSNPSFSRKLALIFGVPGSH